ncbi:hypothetical protein BGW80DRAFT_1179878 [Lactifluus volemus]|nr:hypothetical protein BGW80DRAFT_1179878 [Lactifluus volemus]
MTDNNDLRLESSPHPQVLGIRRNPPSTPSSEFSVVTKRPKYNTTASGSRNRPRRCDFDDTTQAILNAAIREYRAIICTREPFPDTETSRKLSAVAWVNACTARSAQVQLSEDIARMVSAHTYAVMARASEVRGRLKTIARSIVSNVYGVSKLNEDGDNREAIRNLLTRGNFLYRDFEKRTGYLLTPAISDIVNKMWFEDKEDDGIVFSKCFTSDGGGIPPQTIALVCTVIENCLDEYQGGAFSEIPFTRSMYRARYEARLEYFEDFSKKTRQASIIPRLCQRILKLARKHAKADAEPITQKILIEDAEVEAATKEWEDIVFSDEE